MFLDPFRAFLSPCTLVAGEVASEASTLTLNYNGKKMFSIIKFHVYPFIS